MNKPETAQPEKMELTSMDVAEEKREELKRCLGQAFPEVFAEGTIDFDQLKRVLGEWVDPGKERFGLNWPGKAECMKIIQQPSVAALYPDRGESVEFDQTENLFIEGDNLEVLKLLQKPYFGKIGLIYIDPPYNTDGDFIYPDKYAETLETYLTYTGQVDDKGRKFSTNSESGGRYHSRWLNMMWPRIYLAKNLLKEEGLFVCHIDEHESVHLQMLLDDVFGPENNLGTIVWDKRNPKGDSTKIAVQHETILAYAKNIEVFRKSHSLKRSKDNAERMLSKAASLFSKVGKTVVPPDLVEISDKYDLAIDPDKFRREYGLSDAVADYRTWLAKQDVSGGEAAYRLIDENGHVYRTVSMAWPNKKKAPDEYFEPLIHPLTKKPCPVPERGWRNPPDTMKELMASDRIVFGADETKQPERKYYLHENMEENIPSIVPFGGSDDALLNEMGIPFDNPKPVRFVRQIIEYFSSNGDIVLDFFAGSSSVAHAVLEMNAQKNWGSKFIMVQLPEALDPGNAGQKAAFDFCRKHDLPPTVAEISKERIRRASKLIKARDVDQLPFEEGNALDGGFKVFKLDRSNFKIWEGREASEEDVAKQIELQIDHLSDGAGPEDVLYELLLKAGFPLTTKVQEIELAGKQVFSIEDGSMLICLEKEITPELIDALAEANPLQVICLDEGFKGNDQMKANAVQTFRARAQAEESEIVFKTV